jgi:hypothetical protein
MTEIVEKDFYQETFKPEVLDLFKTEADVPHITINGSTYRIESSELKELLWKRYYLEFNSPPSCCLLNNTVKTLFMHTKVFAPVKEVYRRVARIEDTVYIDLCNDKFEAIEITSEGYKIINDPPVKFIRSKAQRPIGKPALDGKPENLHLLKKYFPFKSEDAFILTVAWALGCFNTYGGAPILLLVGEQGAAKSSSSARLKSLIDNSNVPLRNLPNSMKELMIAGCNDYILVFDNISKITNAQSDNLCKVTTGAGYAMRKLYTTQKETQVTSKNPCIVNSINFIPTRQDLLDRCLIADLDFIKPRDRKTNQELTESWEQDRPLILGALCQAVSAALRNYPQVNEKELPRMADFAKWIIAAEEQLPWEKGLFMDTMRKHRSKIVDEAIDADSTALAILRLMETRESWVGTASELLDILGEIIDQAKRKYPDFPKSPNHLSRNINRIAAFLREKGVQFEKKHSGQRFITLQKIEAETVQTAQETPFTGATTPEAKMGMVRETLGERPAIPELTDGDTRDLPAEDEGPAPVSARVHEVGLAPAPEEETDVESEEYDEVDF